jgi:HSP20 family protein
MEVEYMNLITRDPFFGSLFDDFGDFKLKNNIMKSDIYEEDKNYVIEIDVPGFKKEDVCVDYEDGYLTITAKQEEEKNEDSKNYIKRERHYGEMSRSYYIGEIEEDKINAKFKDGTLKLIFPKEEPKKALKQIPIK